MSLSTRILTHLRAGHSLTPRDAQRLFNCDRLGARIQELREAWHDIVTVMEPNAHNRGRHARYWLKTV